MYLVSLRIASNCGLASAAHRLNRIIYSLNAYPINNELNYVLSLMVVEDKGQGQREDVQYLMKELRKDFLDVHIIPSKSSNAIVFTGIKRGHGVLYPLIRNNAIPILPTMASDGYEVFNFLVYNKEYFNKVISEISENNVIDYVNYEKVADANTLMNVLLRRVRELILYDLSDYELSILRTAYERGYFSWPKGMDINELAQRFNVSKPLISYYLRRSLNKILNKILM